MFCETEIVVWNIREIYGLILVIWSFFYLNSYNYCNFQICSTAGIK